MDFGEAIVADIDINLLRTAIHHRQAMHREGIHQFVGKEETGDALRGEIFQAIEPGHATRSADPWPDMLMLQGAH